MNGMTEGREEIKRILNDAESMADLKKVYEFLNRFPLASVMQVSAETGVPAGRIRGYVNTGILKLKKHKMSLK